jgi:hypothetical protein
MKAGNGLSRRGAAIVRHRGAESSKDFVVIRNKAAIATD